MHDQVQNKFADTSNGTEAIDEFKRNMHDALIRMRSIACGPDNLIAIIESIACGEGKAVIFHNANTSPLLQNLHESVACGTDDLVLHESVGCETEVFVTYEDAKTAPIKQVLHESIACGTDDENLYQPVGLGT